MNHFANLVGQEKVKSTLSFYLEAYNKTNNIPFLNFVGATGLGKTCFVREFASNIVDVNGNRKPLIEINSSSIKSSKQFFEHIFLPHVSDQEVIVFFDEAHALPRDLSFALLTICNTEKDHIREYNAGDNNYVFDFSKHHFIFATSESDKLFIPLRNRFITIEFADYNHEDLKKIFMSNLPSVEFDDDALEILAETSRGNARSCVARAQQVKTYVATYGISRFTVEHAKNLFKILGVLPYGLNRVECQILNILKNEGQCSLTSLAAKTGLTRSALQRDFELFLLKKGFISIEGLRGITLKGCKALDKVSLFS